MKTSIILLATLSVSLLSGCGDEQTAPESTSKSAAKPASAPSAMHHPVPKITAPPKREYSFADVNAGGKLYHDNCTGCHGKHAEGGLAPVAPGKAIAPPLNGTGHAWHHPKMALLQTILHGTVSQGGGMPAWKGKLSEAEAGQIIAWMQSRWSDEIYTAWLAADKKTRQRLPQR